MATCLRDWGEKGKTVWRGENKTDSSKESNLNSGKVEKKDKTEEKWYTGARREWRCWLTELELEAQSLKGTRQDVGEHRGSEMQVRKHWRQDCQTSNMRAQKQEEGDQSLPRPPKKPINRQKLIQRPRPGFRRSSCGRMRCRGSFLRKTGVYLALKSLHLK